MKYQLVPKKHLLAKVGNMMNQLIFGMRYSREDALWQRLQQLRDEGIKMIGVCGIVNFLPIVRWLMVF